MSIVDRVKNIFNAKANDALDKVEDPVSITKQGIRDLKVELDSAVSAEAQLKGLIIGQRAEAEKEKGVAAQSLDQANKLKALINGGDKDPLLLDGLKAALHEQTKHNDVAAHLTEQADAKQKSLDGIVSHIEELKASIDGYESDLSELESTNAAAEVAVKVETSLNSDKANSIKANIERVKAKTQTNQHLAEAWSAIADENKTSTEKINEILAKKQAGTADDEAAAFLKS